MRRPAPSSLRSVPTQTYDAAGLRSLLSEAAQARATDLHFKVPGSPRFRVDGRLVRTAHPTLKPADTHRLAQTVLELAGCPEPLASITDLAVGFGVRGEGRFRAQIYRQRGTLGVIVHRMALVPPTLADFGAGDDLAASVWGGPGMTIVVGRKERLSVVAALIEAYNRTAPGHLVAFEHPLEFLHRDDQASIAQREVGVDVPSIEVGLQACMVDDSDAISATDLPDAATAELAIRLAESGRPVVAGLNGCAAHQGLPCIVRLFSQQREREITTRLQQVVRQVIWLEDGKLQRRVGRK